MQTMRMSQLLTKTRKQVPAEEVSKNAQLLIRAGFIHKEMAGAYDYLPLGMRVIENVKQIVREEMNAIGGNEFLMTSLQRKEVWEKTDRWSDENVDVWFKTALQNGHELGLGWSHEEPITDMMRNFIHSYKDLPAYGYQFQNKMRNELRAKSGIMRGREFVMKDLYSYSVSQEQHQAFYDACIAAYHRVFDRLGIGDITYFTLADGGSFTKFSHEFQTVCDAGEDIVYIDKEKRIAVNEEVMQDDVLAERGLSRDRLVKTKTAEVGNIFSFGGSKSEDLGLYFTDEDGQQKPVILGSYGIGITRVIGVITEIKSDDAGLVWSDEIAPYRVHVVRIGDDDDVISAADSAIARLEDEGITVLYDDRNERVGTMLSDADLIGCPHRLVISQKTLADDVVEYKARTASEAERISLDAVLEKL